MRRSSSRETSLSIGSSPQSTSNVNSVGISSKSHSNVRARRSTPSGVRFHETASSQEVVLEQRLDVGHLEEPRPLAACLLGVEQQPFVLPALTGDALRLVLFERVSDGDDRVELVGHDP